MAIHQILSGVPANDWIYLDWPIGTESDKYRELVTYFLYNHRLASNWSKDGYIAPYVTLADRSRTSRECAWVLKYRTPNGSAAGEEPALVS